MPGLALCKVGEVIEEDRSKVFALATQVEALTKRLKDDSTELSMLHVLYTINTNVLSVYETH